MYAWSLDVTCVPFLCLFKFSAHCDHAFLYLLKHMWYVCNSVLTVLSPHCIIYVIFGFVSIVMSPGWGGHFPAYLQASNIWLDAVNYKCYTVRCWILLYYFKYYHSLLWDVVSYLETLEPFDFFKVLLGHIEQTLVQGHFHPGGSLPSAPHLAEKNTNQVWP